MAQNYETMVGVDSESEENQRGYKRPLKPPSFSTKLALAKSSNKSWVNLLEVPIVESGSMLSVSVMGRKIDFWPASDVYYLHSKNAYGHGIAELVKKILEFKKP